MGIFKVFQRRPKPAANTPAAKSGSPASVAQPSAPATRRLPPAAPTAKASTMTGVLIRRLVTEKTTARTAAGQQTFVVSSDANKVTVQRAILARYGIKPTAVRMANVRGKRIRFGRRHGVTKAWKKAVVQLPPGAKIEGEKPAS